MTLGKSFQTLTSVCVKHRGNDIKLFSHVFGPGAAHVLHSSCSASFASVWACFAYLACRLYAGPVLHKSFHASLQVLEGLAILPNLMQTCRGTKALCTACSTLYVEAMKLT